MGSFPPSPAGPGRGAGQILIGHCVLLWSHPSRCFSLAGSTALCILNCSVIRSRSKARGWRECCEKCVGGGFFWPLGSGANEEGAGSHVLLLVQPELLLRVKI